MAYIRYMKNPNGTVYASVVEGVRSGNTVRQKHIVSLGRVINREQGIFQNRERGVYHFSIESGFSDLPHELAQMMPAVAEKEKLILDFGDSFMLYSYMNTLPFSDAIRNAMPSDTDTLLSLLF